MSKLLKAVGRVASGVINRASGGALRVNFQSPQADSVKTTRSMGLFPPTYNSSTTQYFSQPGSTYPSTSTAPGTAMARTACAPVWTGTRFRAVRLNKSTYITRGGGTSRWPAGKLIIHPKGTECVTVRHRNVANVRALRHAISRVRGFVKVYRKAASLVHARGSSRGSRCSSCRGNPCKCK